MPDEKDLQFNRMWNEENTAKRQKFRNRMKSKLDVLHVDFSEQNARDFYHGRLTERRPETLYQESDRGRYEDRGRAPPRRGGPRGRR
jgi:hypothetical protein